MYIFCSLWSKIGIKENSNESYLYTLKNANASSLDRQHNTAKILMDLRFQGVKC